MTEKERRKKKQTAMFTAYGFSVILAAFFVGNLVLKDKSFSDTENRMLAQKPEIQAEQLISGKYAEKFETYYNDQFLFRDGWIKIKAGFDRLTGKVEANGVYLGKDGYLIEDFVPLPEKELEKTYQAIGKFAKKNSEITQYAMIVPNSVSILTNKLPAFAPVKDQNAYLNDTKRRLEKQGITFLDVRDTFKMHNDEKLYYQTDHHWTTSAAYYAFLKAGETMGYDGMAEEYEKLPVTKEFQGTLSAKSGFRSSKKENLDIYLPKEKGLPSVITFADKQIKSASFYDTEKLDTRDGYACFLGGNHGLVKIQTPTEENRRILVLKDSYANCFLPFLATQYREIVVVDPRYYFGSLEELMEVEEIQEVLYLYNANTFYSDTSLRSVINPD